MRRAIGQRANDERPLSKYYQYTNSDYPSCTFYTKCRLVLGMGIFFPDLLRLFSKMQISDFYLTLCRIDEDEQKAKLLLRFLKESTFLEFGIYNCTVSEKTTKDLSHTLGDNHLISKLWFYKVRSVGGFYKLIQGSLSYNNISQLTLQEVGLESFDVNHLTRILMRNTAIKTLNLPGNVVGNEGMKCISKFLLNNSSLEILDISNNYITAIGAEYISQALKSNISLKKLDLGNNRLTGIGIKYLAEGFRSNTTLTFVNISKNNATDSFIPQILHSLRSNTSLNHLDLKDNLIGISGSKAIFKALPGLNPNLTIDLRNNQISYLGNVNNYFVENIKHFKGEMAEIILV